MLAIAGIASATDLVDGGFTGTMNNGNNVIDESELGDGWWSNNGDWDISGGVGYRTTTINTGVMGIGQVIAGNGTTDGSRIAFDVSYSVDDIGAEEFRIILIGFNDADGNFGGANLRVGMAGGVTSILGMTGVDTVVNLYDSGKQTLTGSGTFNVDQAISGTGYDYYAFALLADDFNDGTTADTLTIDNVSFVSTQAETVRGTLFVIK